MKWNIFTKECPSLRDLGLLVLRVAFAIVILYGHGFGKLSTVFSGAEIQFGDPIGIGMHLSFYLAAFAEGICAILLILGLFGRIPAIFLFINFCVILYYHAYLAKDGFPVLELRFLYITGFAALSLMGHGRYSLDNLIADKKR